MQPCIELLLHFIHKKTDTKCIKELDIILRTIKTPTIKHKKKTPTIKYKKKGWSIELSSNSLAMTPNAQTIRAKIGKWDRIIQNFLHNTESIQQRKVTIHRMVGGKEDLQVR